MYQTTKIPELIDPQATYTSNGQEAWRVLGIMAEFAAATERLRGIRPAVSMFGSARVGPDHPYFARAERIARLLAAVDRPNFALNYQVLDLLPQSLAAIQPDDARSLVPLARYYHLKNVQPARDGQGPMPPGAPLGTGVLDYRTILAAAFEAGYAGPLTIEFLSWEKKPVEEKLATDAAWLRSVLAELEQA